MEEVQLLLTSTTRHRAREKIGLSPAVDDGLVVDVLHHTVCSAGKLHLQTPCSDVISVFVVTISVEGDYSIYSAHTFLLVRFVGVSNYRRDILFTFN